MIPETATLIVISEIIKKIVSSIYDETKSYLSEVLKSRLESKKVNFEKCLFDHLQGVLNWASEISFKDLQKVKSVSKTYVDLDIYLTPLKLQFGNIESEKRITLKGVFKQNNHNIMLLGQPGAGKTTTLKKICNEVLFPTDFENLPFDYVLLIRINELSSSNYSIFQKIFSIFNIEIKDFNNDKNIMEKTVLRLLNDKPALVVIDGIDELPNNIYKQDIFEELNKLSLGLTNSKFIASIRSGDFNVNIEKTRVFEICPLSLKQVKEFTKRWFENDQQSVGFLRELETKSYSDLVERPIFISLLCSIFERAGSLPEKPKTIYRKAVSMLIEEWNQQWRIKRESKYAQLDVDRKLEFLSHLAYSLTVEFKSVLFTAANLKMFYKKVFQTYNLPRNEALEVINELETHHGIFIQEGYDVFKFYHKSMQEYLTAEYIIGFPSIPENTKLLKSIPNELAVSVALSSRPTEYIIELILKRLKSEIDSDFIRPFITRLHLENPNFDVNPLFALTLIFLNTKLIEEQQEKSIVKKYLHEYFTSPEFILSFKELTNTTKTFRKLGSRNGINIYHYLGLDTLKYLYNEKLKISSKYCT